MFLTFDTETSGLEDWKRDEDDPAQPHLVQIGAVVADRTWREIASIRLIVRPEGWTITKEATEVHGITNDVASRYGVHVKVALNALMGLVATCKYIAAHNMDFDTRIVQREIRRLGSTDPGLSRTRLRKICTMNTGAAIMPDGKYPNLAMLYEGLIGEPHTEAHDGLSDARAAMQCFRRLVERKLIEL